jgi:hypothetical protein
MFDIDIEPSRLPSVRRRRILFSSAAKSPTHPPRCYRPLLDGCWQFNEPTTCHIKYNDLLMAAGGDGEMMNCCQWDSVNGLMGKKRSVCGCEIPLTKM